MGQSDVDRTFFDAYGQLAKAGHDALAMSGRYRSQAGAEKHIVRDIAAKLEAASGNDLLEIGCGAGNLLIPLSFMVDSAVGIDHPEVIAQAQKRASLANLSYIAGPFPQNAPQRQFDRILIYSVIHYLPDMAQVTDFVMAATGMLARGGRMLIGDIPNSGLKQRFLASDFGIAFQKQWEAARQQTGESGKDAEIAGVFAGRKSVGTLDDAMILALAGKIREAGLHAYIERQHPDLPFGHTREDILVIRP